MEQSDLYAAPKSKLIDKHNDPLRPSASIITLTIFVVFIELVLSLAVAASRSFNKAVPFSTLTLIAYVLFIVVIGPSIFTLLFQMKKKFQNAKSRANLFFCSSLIFMMLQIAFLIDSAS
ncbi:hypothetical protein [Aliikangiella coralliicola]|uniref:Uncharacterized protein n=1 Tax=Aliikangiella coralliicola TaxID=2592383 RepID=A0A545UI28_9GAMM|nr:hypothetical protein [Aliikangiella coralliicola]TQV89126.1 hypothetical protein FLL46_03085 [Aliikangiella coralliicola]